MHVTATITQFRKDLFTLAEHALEGERVEFVYRGVVFHVLPEKKKSKIENLVGQPVLAPGVNLEDAGKELLAEMEKEWLGDWAEL